MNGLIGKKAGMTHIFNDNGDEVPVTVLELGPCPVVQVKTVENDGYDAVQIAYEAIEKKDKKKVRKPIRTRYDNLKIKPHRFLREIRVDSKDENNPQVGDVVKVDDVFTDVEYVTITGTSKGRGYAGVVKRHGYSGAPMSHGSHEQFRHPGSIGMCVEPGRVLPGTKLPGQMGNKRVTTLNLEVVKTYPERNLLLVKGSAPGPNGGLVIVEKSTRKTKKAPAGQKANKKK